MCMYAQGQAGKVFRLFRCSWCAIGGYHASRAHDAGHGLEGGAGARHCFAVIILAYCRQELRSGAMTSADLSVKHLMVRMHDQHRRPVCRVSVKSELLRNGLLKFGMEWLVLCALC